MWRLRDVAAETARGAQAERWRGVLVVLVAAALTALALVFELNARHVAIDAEHRQRAAGRDTFEVSVVGDGGLSANRCLALGGNDAVIAVGGFRDGTTVPIDKAPGETLNARYVVGDMPALLTGHVSPSLAGVAFAGPTATRLGVTSGDRLALGAGLGRPQVTVLDMAARQPDPGAWIYVADSPVEPLNHCWVEVERWAVAAAPQMLSAWFSSGESAIQVRSVLDADRLRQSPNQTFAARSTRYTWAMAGLLIAGFIGALLWFRRAEIALHRTLGCSLPQVVLIHAGQMLLFAVTGVTVGAVTGLYAAAVVGPGLDPADITPSMRQATLVMLSAVVGVTLAASLASAGRISAQLRERL